jgi:predicted flap endonuclease-1-like 5' DNA nuclease
MSAKRFLRKIKQVFGLSGGGGTDTERPGERRTDVTVERETDTGTTRAETSESTTAETPEPTTEGSADTGDSAPTMTEESSTTAEDETADEDGTTVEDETPENVEETPDEASGEPVENIKGIGPTYSDRLAAAGIETVPQLADADPTTVADAAQTGTTKAANWIDRAKARQ